MASTWQRHLLAAVDDLDSNAEWQLTPEAVLATLAVAVALVVVLVLCTCKDSGQSKEQDPTAVNGRSSANAADVGALTIDIPGEGEVTQNATNATPGEAAVSNGVVHNGKHGISPNSHSRQASSGSGQMRPTSLRELPDLPVNNHKRNHSGAEKGAQGRGSGEAKKTGADNNAYDHLGAKIPTNKTAAVNYDHIKLDSPREHSSVNTPASEADTGSEGHYAQVRERTYDVVKDVQARASGGRVKSSGDYDPYTKVKDEDDDKEDPYAKVKDDPYAKVKDDPYAKVKDGGKDNNDGDDDDDGDYAHLKNDHDPPNTGLTTATDTADNEDEDPYEKVMGDSAGGQMVAVDAVDPDDPYTMVSDGSCSQVTVVTAAGSPRTSATRNSQAGVSGKGASGATKQPVAKRVSADLPLRYADEESDGGDPYAVVQKERNPSVRRPEGAEGGRNASEADEIDPYFTTPPEPPRMYDSSEVGGEGVQGAVGGVGVSVGVGVGTTPPPLYQPPPPPQPAAATATSSSRIDSHEHRYTKVTARESLASMTARNALNTYESVTENTYATVEGGSGDGVVRYINQNPAALHHVGSELSETYAEIGASASGGYASPAPEPPSLDTLHSMTKSSSHNGDGDHGISFGNTHRGNGASPSAGNPNVVINDDGYAVVTKSGFSPSETALPQIPRGGMTGSVGSLGSQGGEDVVINGVTLHSDYNTVKDCIPPDQDSENDPNYESVDEALSKAPPSSHSVTATSTTAASSLHSTTLAASSRAPQITVINHVSPARNRNDARNHEYEEVSPPVSPNMAAQGSRVQSTNGASSSGAVPRQDNSEAAEVRDRVLQGHMYEEVSEVKRKSGESQAKRKSGEPEKRKSGDEKRKSDGDKKKSDGDKKHANVSHNVKL